jgi:leader peptidase (prepilin peptidase)/N-methyltransferase
MQIVIVWVTATAFYLRRRGGKARLASLGYGVWCVLLAPFIGSFMGVIVTRAESVPSIICGRSCCASCGVRLNIRDLIPVLSWLFLRGRCRACSQPIGLFHPMIECGALIVALWSALLFTGGLLWASCFFGWMLLTLAATDLKYYLLPDFLTLPLILSGLLVTWIFHSQTLLSNAIGASVGYLFLVLLRRLYRMLRRREGIGLGDAKLLAASGAWVSWNGLPSVILLGALTGIAFAPLGEKHSGSFSLTRIPFGTFLCLSTWIVWLYGPLSLG